MGLKSGRSPREIVLTYLTFKNYKNILKLFDDNSKLMKIGAFPKREYEPNDKKGCFMWFNFFWIRASYVRELSEPIKTDDRFYYEYWCTKMKEKLVMLIKNLPSLFTRMITQDSVFQKPLIL